MRGLASFIRASLEFISELPLRALRNPSAVAEQNERSCLGSCETLEPSFELINASNETPNNTSNTKIDRSCKFLIQRRKIDR